MQKETVIQTSQAATAVTSAGTNAESASAPAPLGTRSLEEQQAALNLAWLSTNGNNQPPADGVRTLIDVMIVSVLCFIIVSPW